MKYDPQEVDFELMAKLSDEDTLAEVVLSQSEYWRKRGYAEGWWAEKSNSTLAHAVIPIIAFLLGGLAVKFFEVI